MKAVFNRNIFLLSPLSQEDLHKILIENVETTRLYDLNLLSSEKEFLGQVRINGFQIQRWGYRNVDLQPRIVGQMESDKTGTRISIEIFASHTIFLYLMMGAMAIIGYLVWAFFFVEEKSVWRIGWLLWLCFICTVPLFMHAWYMRKSISALKKMFEARIIE